MKARKLFCLLISNLALFSAAATADDIDIFTDFTSTAGEADKPDVLFIMDTSGSMDDTVSARDPYVPSTNYCNGTCSDTIYVYNTNFNYLGITISPARNKCDAMITHINDTPASPFYVGRAGELRSTFFGRRWRSVSASNNIVDCEEDSGIHGIDASSPEVHIVNGDADGYSASTTNRVNWGDFFFFGGPIYPSRIYVSENYHNYLQTTPVITRRKIDIMKDAANELVDTFDGLNMGLMQFDDETRCCLGRFNSPFIGGEGGFVVQHFADIDTNQTEIREAIDTFDAEGFTPLSETLWEAHLYFKGDRVALGTDSARDPDAVTGDTYNSPIEADSSCPSQHIVYLTDGTPVLDGSKDDDINAVISGPNCSHVDNTDSSANTCLDDLAGFMATYDYNPDLEGIQSVNTYTIGFDIDNELLRTTASKGNGQFYTASNADELRSAFINTINSIFTSTTSFTAPAVSVNAYNSLRNRNEVYFAVFAPSTNPRWSGNIKKYRIGADGIFRDADGNNAVNPVTGFFAENSRSIWSSSTDGANVRLGGAAENLSNSRRVYTITNSATDNVSLNNPAHIVSLDNVALNNDLLGLPTSATADERAALINWMLGQDSRDENDNNNFIEPNRFIADALHTRPVVVTYADDPNATPAVLDDTLFVTTNDGAFRAIDTENGQEIFAFIPEEVLDNQAVYYLNAIGESRVYGLDGPITIRQQESNDDDQTVEISEGDFVKAYFGMRRGGQSYYALDVSDRSSPRLMWTITGGGGLNPAPGTIDNVTPGFRDLAQSWSPAVDANVKWGCDQDGDNCTIRNVLFFGGGYDANAHDEPDGKPARSAGNAIYMVDADTGTLLWSAGNNTDNLGDDSHNLNLAMTQSIPGEITVADTSGDGNADVMFAIDILGKIWRFDFNSESTGANDFATGGAIADLGAGSSQGLADDAFRRFYVGPFVSLSQQRGRPPFFVISTGSGWNSELQDKSVADRFYGVFEYSVFSAPSYDLNNDGEIEPSEIIYELVDPDTNTVIGPVDNDDLLSLANGTLADPEGNAPHGYYQSADQANGEKFISRPLTIEGRTLFTSYLATGGTVATSCSAASLGSGRAYSIDFVTGETFLIQDLGAGPASGFYDLILPAIGDDGSNSGGSVRIACTGLSCPPDGLGGGSNGQPLEPEIHYWRENL